jgi:hypothetical protein
MHTHGEFLIMNDNSNEQAGWRPEAWLKAAGHPFTLSKLYNEIGAGRLEACKAGNRTTIILTSPAAYYAQLPRSLGRSPNPKAHKQVA